MKSLLTVGIDVAKEKLDFALFNGRKFTLKVYANTEEGIEKLINEMEKIFIQNKEAYEIHFIMEAIGSYHMKALHALSKDNYPVCVLNPIILKRYGEEQLKRSTTIGKCQSFLQAMPTHPFQAFKRVFHLKATIHSSLSSMTLQTESVRNLRSS